MNASGQPPQEPQPRGPRPWGRSDVLILCYHAVSEDWRSSLSVTPEALRTQLELLVSRGYRGVTFSDAALAENGDKVLAVTFDDGYRSVGELAAPVLARVGIPGTVFVPTRFMGIERPMSWQGIEQWIGTPQEDELTPMSWEGLRELDRGGWEIGSHTVSHPRLTTLGDEDLREELVRSREQCAEQVGSCRSIAFPYGDCDERVIEQARVAGYSAVATIPWRLEQSGRFVWPRTGIFQKDGQRVFRLKVSPLLRRLRASRIANLLAPVVRLMRRGADDGEPQGSAE